MKRDRVIYISALVLMFAVCFGVYQFYFKAKLVKYAEDKALLASLNTTYSSLNSTFKEEDPDAVIQQHLAVVESWKDAISARLPYFDDSEWREYEKPPEDVFILQFWYGEQTAAMTKELWEKAQKKYGAQVYQSIPMDVQTMLGVAYAEQWQGFEITTQLVGEQLERLRYGISLFELLMDANAKYIRQVSLYDAAPSGFVGATVENSRVGLAFNMEMEDLVKFLDKLRMSDKYFNVEAIKVSHPYIMMKYEPLMEVELILRRARPKASGVPVAGGAAPGLQAPGTAPGVPPLLGGQGSAGPSAMADDEDEEPVEPEPTGFGKFWKWFKRTVLVSN
jgi:hypothetical protein